jgi:flavodoxin I
MNRALIVYGSTSGNTAYLANFVEAGLLKSGYEVMRKDVREVQFDELKNYELLVFGSSTWDGAKKDGLSGKDQNQNIQGNLQVDMKKFVESLSSYDFSQQAVAVYGVGHYSYTFTCNAANVLEEFVNSHNGRLVIESFRVTDVVDLSEDAIEQWASEIKI